MSNTEELISLGEKIATHFRERVAQEGELDAWRKEAIIACEILLEYLHKTPLEREKLLLLANIIGEKYAESKPPVIPHWCRKISESF